MTRETYQRAQPSTPWVRKGRRRAENSHNRISLVTTERRKTRDGHHIQDDQWDFYIRMRDGQ